MKKPQSFKLSPAPLSSPTPNDDNRNFSSKLNRVSHHIFSNDGLNMKELNSDNTLLKERPQEVHNGDVSEIEEDSKIVLEGELSSVLELDFAFRRTI